MFESHESLNFFFFFWGGGGVMNHFPPPFGKGALHPLPQPFLLHCRQPRIENVISNKLICNQKKLVDKKLFLSLILILFFILGIGNPKGSSIVVRYQHDINYLRDMARNTVEGYDL